MPPEEKINYEKKLLYFLLTHLILRIAFTRGKILHIHTKFKNLPYIITMIVIYLHDLTTLLKSLTKKQDNLTFII